MRIDGVNPLLGPALLAALTNKNDRFAAEKPIAESQTPLPPPQMPAAQIPQPTTSVAMLVALAAIDEPAERRRKAIVQTERGLDALERLRDELAVGIASPERLRELSEWTEGFTMPDDPALAELAREVELRVRAELAKHDFLA